MKRTDRIKFSGSDPDYDIAHFDDPRARAQSRAEIEAALLNKPATQAKKPAAPRQERAKREIVPQAPKVKSAESEAGDSALIKVGVTLKPPISCRADLLALQEAGYEISMILRSALRKMGSSTVTEQFIRHDKGNDWSDYGVRVMRFVKSSTLEAIREDANDLGALSNAELVRGQIQPHWAETLEAFISNVKKTRL